MVGYQRGGVAHDEDPFVQSHATVSVSLFSSEVDIDFSGATSMDRARSLTDFGYADIPMGFDGTFRGFDEGPVEDSFFGPAQEEVAGVFQNSANQVMGSFGAVGQD